MGNPCESEYLDETEFPSWEDLMTHLEFNHGVHWELSERTDGVERTRLRLIWMQHHPNDTTTDTA